MFLWQLIYMYMCVYEEFIFKNITFYENKFSFFSKIMLLSWFYCAVFILLFFNQVKITQLQFDWD